MRPSFMAGLVATALAPSLVLAQASTEPRPPHAGARKPLDAPHNWWNDCVFYEIFVRSFADSSSGDLANDGVGDLRGLIRRLDYLNDANPATSTDLGVTALWLMPIQPSPSYHGYDITDYENIHPQYGTKADFNDLIRACHDRGIRVIIDHVLNHTSHLHPWFSDATDPASPRHDWYLWNDPAPTWKGPWKQNVWHRVGDAKGHALADLSRARGTYYGIFSPYMPDLNYKNPAVSDEMLRVTRFWLTDMKADGLRLDAIRHLVEAGEIQENTAETHEWLRRFFRECKAANPNALSVGEVWTSSEVASQYVGDQMDLVFEFDLSYAIIDTVNAENVDRLAKTLVAIASLYPANQYATFLSNHDQTRVATSLRRDPEKLRLAASILLTGPGVPFLYYAEELGAAGDKPDENLRTPMPWSAEEHAGFSTQKPWRDPQDDFRALNVEVQTNDPASLLSHYRTLIRARTSCPPLRRGSLELLHTGNRHVLATLRSLPDSSALVLVNPTDKPVSDYAVRVPPELLARLAKPRSLLDSLDITPPMPDKPWTPATLPPRSVVVVVH